jgi:hypothetical protein
MSLQRLDISNKLYILSMGCETSKDIINPIELQGQNLDYTPLVVPEKRPDKPV